MSKDIIVIGGGLAGLAVANRAAELGLHPIVLEQGGDPQYFCNSRFAGGLLHVAFKDMRAPPDDIIAAIEAQTGPGDATANAAVMAREYNSRPLVPEVLVQGDQFAVIRARPTIDEMLARDTIPAWL